MPNWAEQVTAIATAVSALGLLSAIGAVVFRQPASPRSPHWPGGRDRG